mmetsp:Transcript_106781/g.212050  ORF Transcript_106781/g.212050 Transcript_106781/m.212050 type:complete len:316 (+) Transcript_106781:2-949(+)
MAVEGPLPPRRITRAIVSAAGRRTCLNHSKLPKTLLDIEGTTLIEHVLRQLHAGGIVHVTLVLSYQTAATVVEVERVCNSLKTLLVDVVDLGSDYNGFYAMSLLAAQNSSLPEEDGVLIAMADHIFDPQLVSDMCKVQLRPNDVEACVLTDLSNGPHIGLPETAVGVRCSGNGSRITEISRRLARPMVEGAPCQPGIGIEAGLVVCRPSLFCQIEALAEQGCYFSLADALQELAHDGLATCLCTNGQRWIAVETQEELELAREVNNNRLLLLSGLKDNQDESDDEGFDPNFRQSMPVFFVAGGSRWVAKGVPAAL